MIFWVYLYLERKEVLLNPHLVLSYTGRLEGDLFSITLH